MIVNDLNFVIFIICYSINLISSILSLPLSKVYFIYMRHRSVNCVNVLFLWHKKSVFFGNGYPSLPLRQGAISLRPVPSPAFGDWAPPSLPPPELHGWKTQLHLIHFWFSFLFFCPSVYSSALLLSVLISPTPLLCHQLAPSVSKSWSHCACIALFLFLITHMYACTVVAFHKHIHRTYIGHAYLHCYYQPLTSLAVWIYHLTFLFKMGVNTQYDWYALVQKLQLRTTLKHTATVVSWYHSFWCSGSWMNGLCDWHSQEIVLGETTK